MGSKTVDEVSAIMAAINKLADNYHYDLNRRVTALDVIANQLNIIRHRLSQRELAERRKQRRLERRAAAPPQEADHASE